MFVPFSKLVSNIEKSYQIFNFSLGIQKELIEHLYWFCYIWCEFTKGHNLGYFQRIWSSYLKYIHFNWQSLSWSDWSPHIKTKHNTACCGSVQFWVIMKNPLYCDISYNSKVPVQKDALINGRKLPYTTFNDLIMINSTII